MEHLVELLMPKLWSGARVGEIEQWFKREGQLVRRGESLAQVKEGGSRTVCRSSDYGVLVEIVAQEGQPVTVGDVIARLRFNGDSGPAMFEEEGLQLSRREEGVVPLVSSEEEESHAVDPFDSPGDPATEGVPWEDRLEDDGWAA